MTILVGSLAVTCAFSVLIGQLAMRLTGVREWHWLAPAVGISIVLLVSSLALVVPGRAILPLVLLLGLAAAGLVSMVRCAAWRPPAGPLLAGLLVAGLVVLPFLSSWRAGTLGVAFNNDMHNHLKWAEAIRFDYVARVNIIEDGYPYGPHSFVAALSQMFGARVDFVFSGVTIAAPVLIAWTAIGALSDRTFLRSAGVALVAGLPFAVAAYVAQGAFKEVYMALFALAAVMSLLFAGGSSSRWRLAPLAVIAAGAVSVYSVQALAWIGPVILVWLVVRGAMLVHRERNLSGIARQVWSGLPTVGIALLVFLVALAPQLDRFVAFSSRTVPGQGTGIPSDSLGNLTARILGWLAFGIWDRPDFQYPPIDLTTTIIWAGFVIALALWGSVVCFARDEWIIPVGAILALGVWFLANETQSPYVAAKALPIASPLILLLAALGVMDRAPERFGMPKWWGVAAAILAVVLVFKVDRSSYAALRLANVGATDHVDELRELRKGLIGQSTLFIGNDEFVDWALAGVNVGSPALGAQPPGFETVPTRAEKPWLLTGSAMDFDALDASVYNRYRWLITPRDLGGSTLPKGWRLERSTATYDLYRRTGLVPNREILPEGYEPGSYLRCWDKAGRRALRRGGLASVRTPARSVPLLPVKEGQPASGSLVLPPGTWKMTMPYFSSRPLDVRVGTKSFALPPSMDRPGPRLPVGEISIDRRQRVAVKVSMVTNVLTPPSIVSFPNGVIFTLDEPVKLVPVNEACNEYVDWILPGASAAGSP